AQIEAATTNVDSRQIMRVLTSTIGWRIAEQQGEGEKNPFEGQVAAFGQKPFGRRVGFTALPAGPDRHSRYIERERDIGVGGGAVEMRADSQMGVYRADISEDRGAVGQLAGGTRADLFEPGDDLAA